jgi:hypothetical protein
MLLDTWSMSDLQFRIDFLVLRTGILIPIRMPHPSNDRNRTSIGVTMSDNFSRQAEFSGKNISAVQQPNRRSFLLGAASAVAFAVCRPSFAFGAGTVTVIQFSDAGKPTGKATIPKVARPDAEWKQKLAPISFEVARRAAITPSSVQRPSSNPVRDGQASGSPLPRRTSLKYKT